MGDLSIAESSLTTYSKTRVRVSLVWMMSWRSTMLACFRPFRRDAAETESTERELMGSTFGDIRGTAVIYAFISSIIRMQLRPFISLATYMQGI